MVCNGLLDEPEDFFVRSCEEEEDFVVRPCGEEDVLVHLVEDDVVWESLEEVVSIL